MNIPLKPIATAGLLAILITGCANPTLPQATTTTPDAATSITGVASTKDDSQDAGEDAAQGTNNIVKDHPAPTYESLDAVIAYPKGLHTPSDLAAYTHIPTQTPVRIQQALKPISDASQANEQELERLYTQLLYLFAADYSAIKPLNEYGYIAFQQDGKDPITGQALTQDARINLELVLDASGSMAQQIDGQSMMDIAKASITKTVSQLPPNAQVGLRVYGHKGNNTRAGKAVSCASSDLIHPISPVNSDALTAQLQAISPTGWTPLGTSIALGAKDFEPFQQAEDLNILYVISDGVETCDTDPITSAQGLQSLPVKPVLGIIGFNVDPTQERNLRAIATAGNGHYASADTADKLVAELARIHEIANAKYDWQPLSEETITTLNHQLTNKGNLELQSTFNDRIIAENNIIDLAISYLQQTGRLSQTGTEKMRHLNSLRYERLSLLKNAQHAQREADIEQITKTYASRLGESAVLIIPATD